VVECGVVLYDSKKTHKLLMEGEFRMVSRSESLLKSMDKMLCSTIREGVVRCATNMYHMISLEELLELIRSELWAIVWVTQMRRTNDATHGWLLMMLWRSLGSLLAIWSEHQPQ